MIVLNVHCYRILGLGPTGLTKGTVSNGETVPTLLDTLYAQNKISDEIVGIYFHPETGAVCPSPSYWSPNELIVFRTLMTKMASSH